MLVRSDGTSEGCVLDVRVLRVVANVVDELLRRQFPLADSVDGDEEREAK